MVENEANSLISLYEIFGQFRGGNHSFQRSLKEKVVVKEKFTINYNDVIYKEVCQVYRNLFGNGSEDINNVISINLKWSTLRPLKRCELKKFNKDLKAFKAMRNTEEYLHDPAFQDEIDKRIKKLEDKEGRTKAYIKELYNKNKNNIPEISDRQNAVMISEQLSREDICFKENKPFLTLEQAEHYLELNSHILQSPVQVIYDRVKKYLH